MLLKFLRVLIEKSVFQQIYPTRYLKLKAEGHGFSLSIVKRIIEKHYCEVGIESNNLPGESSVFYFIRNMAT